MWTNEKQPGQTGLLEGGRGFDRKFWEKKYTKTVPETLVERYRNTMLQSRLSAKIAVPTYSVVKVLKTKRNSESRWGMHSTVFIVKMMTL